MNVCVLHYHFNPGGVTQVVANHVRSLAMSQQGAEPLRLLLFHGGSASGLPADLAAQVASTGHPAPTQHVVASLAYDDGVVSHDELLADQLREALKAADCSPRNSLLHVHNHSLGKNVSLPGALARLAGDGYRLLLQIHDFAEDFRPENYRRLSAALAQRNPMSGSSTLATLYPQASHIHYAVLNQRDFVLLREAGVAETNLHWLPNAVSEFGELPERNPARDKLQELCGLAREDHYLLYPVRCIRRKNLGEAVLWAALAAGEATIGFTIAPASSVERPSYRRWKQLAERLGLRCLFESGGEGRMAFRENLAAADKLITTSVAEGFGMVFLESWLARRQLVGRNLPEITADFRTAGVDFDALYDHLQVPFAWIGRDAIRQALAAEVSRLSDDYAIDLSRFMNIDALLEAPHIDFAHLTGPLQARVVEMVVTGALQREQMLELNPKLHAALRRQDPTTVVDGNAAAVRASYSLEVSGTRLAELYRHVLASPTEVNVRPLPGADAVLHGFLTAARLHPIRFEP